MHWNYPGKKFLRKPFLLNHQKRYYTNQGVFLKEETKGYLNMNFKKGVTNIDYVWMSLEVTSKFNIPVITPTHTHTHTHRRSTHSFLFTPLLYYGIFWHVGIFLNIKLQ